MTTIDARIGNFITGNPERIAAILDAHPEYFAGAPFATLRRDVTETRTRTSP